MENKKLLIYLLIVIILSILLGIETVFLFKKDKEYTKNIETTTIYYENKIDSLDNEIRKLKLDNTQLIERKDSIITKIIYLKEKYEKDYINIVDQPVNCDMEFFRKYLSDIEF